MSNRLISARHAVIVEEESADDATHDDLGWLRRLVLGGPRWRFVLAVVLGLAAVLGVVVGSLAQFGAGPLAPRAPMSWVFFAAASGPTEPAREVLAIDVATGELHWFEIGAPIFDLRLSADRQRIFVASDEGRIFVLNATRGTVERILHTRSTSAVSNLLLVHETRVLAVIDEPAGSTLALLDATTGDKVGTLSLEQRIAGRPVLAQQILVPVAPRLSGGGRATSSSSVLTISEEPLAIDSEHTIARRDEPGFSLGYLGKPSLPPVLLLSAEGVIDFDATTALLAQLNTAEPRVVDIAKRYVHTRTDHLFLSDLWGDAQVGPSGRVVHLCIGRSGGAGSPDAARQRYIVPLDSFEPVAVGDDCGVFARAGDGTLILATGDRLDVLDERTGRVTKSLPLHAHFPRRAA